MRHLTCALHLSRNYKGWVWCREDGGGWGFPRDCGKCAWHVAVVWGLVFAYEHGNVSKYSHHTRAPLIWSHERAP